MLVPRVRKNASNDFTLLVASVDPQPRTQHSIKAVLADATLTLEYGDFSESMQQIVAALKEVTEC